MKKVVIAGGTGFIGKYIAQRFTETGYNVQIISRSPNHVSWNPIELKEALENAEILINLSGKSINCKHNDENKLELLNSRVNSTIWLGNAILACTIPPKVWINSSASGIYKPTIIRVATENEHVLGTNFLSELVQKWENSFFEFTLPNTRQIALRTSVVLGKNGGALKPLVLLSKLGLGGKQASGEQIFSWIHIEDYYQILLFSMEKNSVSGIINCTSPYPVSNNKLMRTIRKTLHIPFGIPAPEFAIKFAANIINTEASLLLDSSNLVPQKLLQAGYNFRFSKLRNALSHILK